MVIDNTLTTVYNMIELLIMEIYNDSNTNMH